MVIHRIKIVKYNNTNYVLCYYPETYTPIRINRLKAPNQFITFLRA